MSLFTFLQRSLFVRVVVIFVTTLLTIFLLVQLFLQTSLLFRLFPQVMHKHAEATAELVFLVENVPESAVAIVLSAFSSPSRSARISQGFADDSAQSDILSRPFRYLATSSEYALGPRETRFRMLNAHELLNITAGHSGNTHIAVSALEISIKLKNGTVLAILLTPIAIIGGVSSVFLLFVFTILTITAVVSLLIVFKPLNRLESAAQGIGLTGKPVLVRESGTEDIRRVTRAINAMQIRIKDLLSERSNMVAALAHDIRTSLTHMKLRLDLVDQKQAKPLQADMSKMEYLISDMLLYARAEQANVSPELIELNQFTSQLVSSLPYAMEFRRQGSEFVIAAVPSSIARALTNLIENATTYAGSTEVNCRSDQQGFTIEILDAGPGIPPAQLKKIFDPFYRGEPSRNKNTGGTGLGLTIARNLLSAQGATLNLYNRADGGLCAEVFFSAHIRVE